MTRHIILLFVISIALFQCSSPEGTFQKAEKSRSKKAFEQFIQDYPESELVEQARNRISELSFWEKIDSSLTEEPYQTYIDSFANGLFIKDAQNRLQDIKAFRKTREKDIVDAYNAFSEKYPISLFTDSLLKRIDYLKPAQLKFQTMSSETSSIALKAYVKEFRDTGYGRLIQSRLDSVALPLAEKKVLSQARYKNLPQEIDMLLHYIENEKNESNNLLAKQALEQIIIEQLKIAGYGNRFVIPDIEVDFRIEGDSRYVIRGADGDENQVVISTMYPDDSFVMPFGFGGMLFSGTGDMAMKSLDPSIYYDDGTVWRFSGKVAIIPGYTFTGLPNNPLSFYLMRDVGAIYIHGKGSVIKGDGQIIFSNVD